MSKYRQVRIAEEIKKSVSSLLVSGIKDPRLSGQIISISGVDVSPDGRYANIYVSPLLTDDNDKESKYSEILEALKSSKGLIRKQISLDVKLRYTPEINFEIDRTLDYGRHIDELLESIKK